MKIYFNHIIIFNFIIVWDRGELEQYIEKKKENRGFLK